MFLIRTLFTQFSLFLLFTSQASASFAPDLSSTMMTPSFGLVYTDARITKPPASGSYSSSPQLGFTLGFDLLIPSYGDYVDYQSGLYYSQSQTDFQETVYGDFSTTQTIGSIRLSRVSAPFIIRLYPFTRSVGLYTQGGVSVNYWLNGVVNTRTTSSQGLSENQEYNLKEESGFQPLTADALVGIGFSTRLYRSLGFFVEVNYRYGLTPITSGDRSIRADTLFTQFGIGF